MKIAIPTAEGKLCAHFGHCESFTFAKINPVTNEIKLKDVYRTKMC